MTYYISVKKYRRVTIYRYVYVTSNRHIYYEQCVCSGRVFDRTYYDRDSDFALNIKY